MRNIFLVLVACALFFACDDGDVITIDLDFDQTLDLCANNTDSFTVYDLRNDPSESLAIIIPRTVNDVAPFIEPTGIDNPNTITIGANGNRLLYRTYNRDIANSSGNQELCNAVIASDLTIQESYEANGGTVEVTIAVEDDDNDGIPSDQEGRGLIDTNGNYPDAEDSDGDGVPDYQDQDDDNDNVLTEDELDTENLDGDDDPLTNPLDTDGDGVPNYLDTDDDEDGILTINEDENENQNPADDLNIDSGGILVADYKNDEITVNYGDFGKRPNAYTRVVTSQYLIRNFDLEILSQDFIDFGTLIYNITIEQEFEED